MEIMELIRTRKSVRTFDGRALSGEHLDKLRTFLADVPNPYGIPVTFALLDAKEHSLSSPVIQGEQIYLIGKVPQTEHCEAAFGYSFEKAVLYAWSLGIGTTWIGGTMKRAHFEEEAKLQAGEIMPCVSPLGYPAKKRSLKEIAMRTGIRADKRFDDALLFFSNRFAAPLDVNADPAKTALEAVRLAPSAVNKQPWRIVRCGNAYHFYEEPTLGATGAAWDVQKVDMGIAICHFMSIAGGTLSVSAPAIDVPKNLVYIATVTL